MGKIFLLYDQDDVREKDFTEYGSGTAVVFKMNGRFDAEQEGKIASCPRCGQLGLRGEDRSFGEYKILVLHKPGQCCVLSQIPKHVVGCPEVECPECGRRGWRKEVNARFSQEVLTVVYHGPREDIYCEIARRPKEFPRYLTDEELKELQDTGRVVIPANRPEMFGSGLACWHRGHDNPEVCPTGWYHDPSDKGRGPGWVRVRFSSSENGETIFSLADEGRRVEKVGESWDTIYYRVTWDNPANHQLCLGCGLIVRNVRPLYEEYSRLQSEGEPGSTLGRSLTYEPGDPY